jgi:hypothetical protein
LLSAFSFQPSAFSCERYRIGLKPAREAVRRKLKAEGYGLVEVVPVVSVGSAVAPAPSLGERSESPTSMVSVVTASVELSSTLGVAGEIVAVLSDVWFSRLRHPPRRAVRMMNAIATVDFTQTLSFLEVVSASRCKKPDRIG